MINKKQKYYVYLLVSFRNKKVISYVCYTKDLKKRLNLQKAPKIGQICMIYLFKLKALKNSICLITGIKFQNILWYLSKIKKSNRKSFQKSAENSALQS